MKLEILTIYKLKNIYNKGQKVLTQKKKKEKKNKLQNENANMTSN
jgi:hypothetical protein